MSNRFFVMASAIVLAATLAGRFKAYPPSQVSFPASHYTATDDIEADYSEAVATISSNYAGEIDYEKAGQAAIQGMLTTLDPHSNYFPWQEFKKQRRSEFPVYGLASAS